MIIIKENGRVYIIDSIYPFTFDGKADQMLVPENVPIFKATGSRAIIAGVEQADLDPLRYVRLPFPKTLSQKSMVDKISPKVESILFGLGREDEDDELSPIIFAKDKQAFMRMPNGDILEIGSAEVVGVKDDYIRYFLACTKGMPVKKRVQAVYKALSNITGANLFPLFMMDTVSLKLTFVEEEKA